ncbi:MAG TPA: hypothetical protein VGY56_18320 [Verrucomicrobiae bacterium]|nr:hypothetical protein [Verrucomicrobiae bacterium]
MSTKLKIVLDTNCFINAQNNVALSHCAVQEILKEHENGTIELYVSRHTLDELERKPDAALGIAKTFPVLPHFPVGTWAEQVASWDQMEGTWCDAEVNDSVQQELSKLAKSGNDIRDRGAFLDALRAKADVFVTSDQHLVANGPAKRIFERFGLRILSPTQLLPVIQSRS